MAVEFIDNVSTNTESTDDGILFSILNFHNGKITRTYIKWNLAET